MFLGILLSSTPILVLYISYTSNITNEPAMELLNISNNNVQNNTQNNWSHWEILIKIFVN